MSFFQELQRRKVIRTVIAYLVAAFAVAQGAQLLVDALDLPRVILKAVVVIAIIALPVVIATAWMFDASSSGLQPSDQSRRSISWGKFAGAVAVVLAGVVGVTALVSRRGAGKELDRDLIAVLPFRVTGTADLAFLREGMLDLLATKLTSETGTRAADPRTVLSALADKKLSDAALGDGRGFAKSIGAGQVLLGSIVGNAKHFTVTASLVDLAGRHATPAQVEGTLDSLTSVVDRLAAALLSLHAGEGSQRLTALTSTSLPALRAYLDAQSAFRIAHFHEAVQKYARALDLDSTFALAAMGHALSVGWGDVPDATVERSNRLLVQNLNRLGPIDRLMAVAVGGDHYPDARNVRQRIQAWEEVLAKAPDRADAWFEYGDHLLHFGALAEYPDNFGLARRAFARALQLDSMNTLSLLHLTDLAVMGGDRKEVVRLDGMRARRDPTGRSGRYQFAIRSRFLGDSAALQSLRAAADTLAFGELYVLTFGPALLGTGIGDALFAIDRWLARATTAEEKLQAYGAAHDGYLAMGMPARAAAMLRARMSIKPNPVATSVIAISDALYADGDAQLGEEGVATLRRLKANSTSNDARAAAACFVDQWDLLHGKNVDVDDDVASFRNVGANPRERLSADLCGLLLRALQADLSKQADAVQKRGALDAFLRNGPHADLRLVSIANLIASRLYERGGDPKDALRAVRRRARTPEAFEMGEMATREEARLAGIAGERDNAIRLYRRYLAMHSQAEAALKAADDAARRDLARLTAER